MSNATNNYGYDDVNAVTGRVLLAQSPERFTYDADSNISEYIVSAH